MKRLGSRDTVIVGHFPYDRKNPRCVDLPSGARVIFLDTGAGPVGGKKGPVSWLDLRLEHILTPAALAHAVTNIPRGDVTDFLSDWD